VDPTATAARYGRRQTYDGWMGAHGGPSQISPQQPVRSSG
jgi:hypothetical protein